MTKIKNIIDNNDFQTEVLKSDIPVLVDFWATWCGPCQMLAPVLDTVAEEYASKIKVVKVNVDESTAIASEYGIRSIPTLILFKNGEKVATNTGMASKAQLDTFINNNI